MRLPHPQASAPLLRHFLLEDERMEQYRDLYFKLFAAMADAVELLERDEPLDARKRLIAAMQRAEELVIEEEN